MSAVQGLVIQDKFLFWQFLLNNFYFRFGQRNHYLLGEPHSLTQKLPTSFPLFSSSLLSFSLHYKSSFSGNWNLRGFLECLCEEVVGTKWQFIGGKRGRAGALCRWVGAHLWCPSWLPFLHSLLCIIFMPKNNSMVVVGRWKSAGEWRYVGGSNNVMGCVWGVVYDMWDPRSVGHASRRLL